MRFLDHVGPVGVNAELLHVGDDEQRRVLEIARIELQLLERRVEVLAGALVLPGKAPALPHIRPPVAATGLGGAPLEGVPLACGSASVGDFSPSSRQRSLKCDCAAARSRSSRAAPSVDELLWCHGGAPRSVRAHINSCQMLGRATGVREINRRTPRPSPSGCRPPLRRWRPPPIRSRRGGRRRWGRTAARGCRAH